MEIAAYILLLHTLLQNRLTVMPTALFDYCEIALLTGLLRITGICDQHLLGC